MMTESQRAALAEYAAVKGQCPARERLAALFDDGVYTETGSNLRAGENLAGVVTAYGYIGGTPAYAFSQDSTVMKGAVSLAHSAKICKMFELAARNGVPVVGIYDSCGAFVEDGADALNAYSDILLSMGSLSGVVPMVSVISGVCAGTMAMIASSADFSVITEGAELYLDASGNNASAESAAKSGAVSAYAKSDAEAMDTVRRYLSLMPQNNLSPLPEFEFDAPVSAAFDNAENAAESIADAGSILEVYGGYGTASYTALCTVSGVTAGIAATNKTKDKLTSVDCSKIARFVRLCDAYSIPVITVADTEGFDLHGADMVRAGAALAGAYAEASCAKIALVSGKACGMAYIAFAGRNVAADAVYALPEAVIAPMDPVSAAEFLYHDKLKGADDLAAARAQIAKEYAENEGSAFAAAAKGAADEVVTAENVRAAVASVLDVTAGKRLNKRLPKKHNILPL